MDKRDGRGEEESISSDREKELFVSKKDHF